MLANAQAARAYGNAATLRGPKEQDADIFRRVNFRLRAAAETPSAEIMPRIRAVADNRCLWLAMATLIRDPLNPLPAELRAQIASVGETVLRTCNEAEPDLQFLIGVNEAIAAGLSGQP